MTHWSIDAPTLVLSAEPELAQPSASNSGPALYISDIQPCWAEPSKPGFVSLFTPAVGGRRHEQVVPSQPAGQDVGVGATQLPLPLHVDGPLAPSLLQEACAQIVDDVG